MIERVTGEGLPFEIVCCGTLYGRSYWLRRKMSGAGLVYYADVPADTKVYLEKPVVGRPKQERAPLHQAASVEQGAAG
jgi:hypothetical protein